MDWGSCEKLPGSQWLCSSGEEGGISSKKPSQDSELSLQMLMVCTPLILLSLIPNYRKHIVFTLGQTSKQKARTTINFSHPLYRSSACGIRFSGARCAGRLREELCEHLLISWFQQLKCRSPFGLGGRPFHQHNQGITALHALPGKPGPNSDVRSLCFGWRFKNHMLRLCRETKMWVSLEWNLIYHSYGFWEFVKAFHDNKAFIFSGANNPLVWCLLSFHFSCGLSQDKMLCP